MMNLTQDSSYGLGIRCVNSIHSFTKRMPHRSWPEGRRPEAGVNGKVERDPHDHCQQYQLHFQRKWEILRLVASLEL